MAQGEFPQRDAFDGYPANHSAASNKACISLSRNVLTMGNAIFWQ